MKDERRIAYFNERFDALTDNQLQRCKTFIIRKTTPQERGLLKSAYKQHGEHDWMHHVGGGHFRMGMFIRNLLRQVMHDDELPLEPKNWDDYYIQVMEYALGMKERK